MKKYIFLCFLIVFLFSFTGSHIYFLSSDNITDGYISSINIQAGNQGTRIRVENNTCYNVSFEGNHRINKFSNGYVVLYTESGILSRDFDIWYEIPLSGTVPLYVIGDRRTIRENQTTLNIVEPRLTENYGRYITILNKADNAITFRTNNMPNLLVEQRGTFSSENALRPTNKSEFSPGETAVFDISRDFENENYAIYDSRRSIPFALPKPLKNNYLYVFEYTASGVTLTDVRPLHRAGESGWVKQIPEAIAAMPLVTGNGEIRLLLPAGNGLFRRAYDSAGNIKSQVQNGGSFSVSFAVNTADGLFIGGYRQNGNYYEPVVRIHSENGTVQRLLEPSRNHEYFSAFYNSAAGNDNVWLAAGGADTGGVTGAQSGFFPAYVRQMRDNGLTLAAEWELGREDFEAALKITDETPFSEPRCGEVKCAVYDSVRNCWLVSGKNLAFDFNSGKPVTGSYLAVISNDGKIQKVDTSYSGMSFNKIIPDANGNYYLAGAEQKGNETQAVIIKYNADGRLIWRLNVQPQSNSWYQDAMLDVENNQIVLGGTLSAKDENGNGGSPFIEALDIENGNRLWQEILTDAVLSKAVLLTAIVPAPDYGYAVTLSGPGNGNDIESPYIIARINARGKIIK